MKGILKMTKQERTDNIISIMLTHLNTAKEQKSAYEYMLAGYYLGKLCEIDRKIAKSYTQEITNARSSI